jgi:hypothetical protein
MNSYSIDVDYLIFSCSLKLQFTLKALYSYIFSSFGLLFGLPDAYVVNNRHLFIRNSEIYNIGARQNSNLFPPSISITKVQKGAYYSGLRIFNHLPAKLKELSNSGSGLPSNATLV